MSLNVCPAALVAAPAEKVWALLTEQYDGWTDAEFAKAEPPGAAHPGQVLHFRARALGRGWGVQIRVVAVDPDRRQLQLATTLPLGMRVANTISVAAIDPATCRVQYG